MGSGIGSLGFAKMLAAIAAVFAAAGPAGLQVETTRLALAGVERAWDSAGSDARLVFTP